MIDYELKGKIAIVTGGSDGLGRATAKKLAQEGANVIICARREKNLMDAAKSISEELLDLLLVFKQMLHLKMIAVG